MYFPINSDFPNSIPGRQFHDQYGMVGWGILTNLVHFANQEPDKQFKLEGLLDFALYCKQDAQLVTDILCSLISKKAIVYNAARNTLGTIELEESLNLLQLKRQVLKENKENSKKVRSVQKSVQTSGLTSEQTSCIVQSCIVSNPSKKKYLDTVLLSDEEFAGVETRYSKDGLTKRDVQRGIELLNEWFLNNPIKRAERNSDHRTLVGWPLTRVLEEKTTQQKLHNQQAVANKFSGNGATAPPTNTSPVRGFPIAECSKEGAGDGTS